MNKKTVNFVLNENNKSNQLKKSMKIQYISINYLLKLLLLNNEDIYLLLNNSFTHTNNNFIFFDNKFSLSKLMYSFILFHTLFIETNTLFSKIKSIYDYYNKKNCKMYIYILIYLYYLLIFKYTKK